MLIEIWTKEGCTRCTKVIEALRKEFIDAEIVEYDIENIVDERFELRSMVQVNLRCKTWSCQLFFMAGSLLILIRLWARVAMWFVGLGRGRNDL